MKSVGDILVGHGGIASCISSKGYLLGEKIEYGNLKMIEFY